MDPSPDLWSGTASPTATVLRLLIALGVLTALAIAAFILLELRALSVPKLVSPTESGLAAKAATLNRWLDALHEKGRFNGTLLYALDGKVLYQRNLGHADALSRRPVTDRTAFNLASVSKHITAFAILLLEHEKRLSRGDRLAEHIPELAHYDGVSLDHLLYHCSGIPDYAASRRFRRGLKRRGRAMTVEDLIAWLRRPGNRARFSPGRKDAYSNSNYVLLAEVIARVSGVPFAEFLQHRLFDPLGMRDTAVVNRLVNRDRLRDRAFGFRKRHLYFGAAVAHDLNALDGAAGDGNIYASARDLVLWDRALRDGTLLPAAAYEVAYDPFRLNDGAVPESKVFGKRQRLGLGWNVQDRRIATAYGAWLGASACYRRNLDRGSALVLLTNDGSFLRSAIVADKVAKLFEGT